MMRRLLLGVPILGVLAVVAACGSNARPVDPLSSTEAAAVGSYRIDLVHEVTEEQLRILESVHLVLRDDRSFQHTEWLKKSRARMRTTGTWRIEGDALHLAVTGHTMPDDPDFPHVDWPEPGVVTWPFEDGAIRRWPHRPYLLRLEK